MEQTKIRFLLKNLLRGLAYMAILALAYFLFMRYISEDHALWLKQFYQRPLLIYLIYIGSEVFFGLFPPEIFMIWALYKGDQLHYWMNATFFALVSYGAGFLCFLVGRYLQRVVLFRYVSRRFFSRYWPLFRKYGSILIVTAALTPLPWATISILVGTSAYPTRKFLLVAFIRIFRYALYGYLIFYTRQF
ncbi:MAG: VTT domain-containing protein [Mangrovibacterium sp.]|nr:VTT domain-containing protein [Mangrovibacterium sp.]